MGIGKQYPNLAKIDKFNNFARILRQAQDERGCNQIQGNQIQDERRGMWLFEFMTK